MFTREALRLYWQEIRPYYIFSVMLFFAGVVIGGSDGSPVAWIEQSLGGLSQLAQTVEQSDHPQMTMFLLVLANNLFKTAMAMALGLFAGLLPMFMLVMNGMIIGYLLATIGEEGHNVLEVIVKGLLPHGIIELMALFLACAFGLRFGMTLIRGIWGSMFGREEPWQPFVRTAIGSVPAIAAVGAAIVAAAAIESTITFWLVN